MGSKRDAEHDLIDVEVAFASPDTQRLVSIQVPRGTRVREVLRLSKLADSIDEIDVENCALGIFGRVVEEDYTPVSGDRVEVYRPLRLDPQQARRERARSVRRERPSRSREPDHR